MIFFEKRNLGARYVCSIYINIKTLKQSLSKQSIEIFAIFFQWDILSNGGLVQEMAHIANGRHSGNCVSLLRVNVSTLFSSFLKKIEEQLLVNI